MRLAALCLAIQAISGSSCLAQAVSIGVSPVSLEVVASASAAMSINVKNAGFGPINVQSRVQRWSAFEGRDALTPTEDVVLSPAIVQVAAGQEQVIRVIRISQAPVNGEESYRILVDQLPSSSRNGATNVSLVVRQSLPLFIHTAEAKKAPMSFSLQRRGNKPVLVANNPGDLHQKLTDLIVQTAGGQTLFEKRGLAGYVLGHSTFEWLLTKPSPGKMVVQAQTADGPIAVPVTWQ